MPNEIKVPIWFWIVSALALLWNLGGLWDFYNSASLNEEYLAAYPGYLEFVKSMPAWAMGAWGTAIIGSVLGALCLLLRKAWAFPLFALAIVGMVISFGYQFMASTKPESNTTTMAMTIVIWALAFFLLWFAKMSKAKGWLQ